MIERVRVDPLLHRIGPLLIRDGHVSDLPSDGCAESFDHLSHRRRLADQRIHTLLRRTRTSKQGCGYTGYVCRADEGNDGRIRTPRQEDGALFSNAPTDKRAHVFVIGRGLDMNGAHLRPVEDAVSQPMLQIPEAGSMLQIAKGASLGVP